MSVSVLYFSNIVIHFIFTNVTFRVLNALVWVQFSPYSSGILDISPDSLSISATHAAVWGVQTYFSPLARNPLPSICFPQPANRYSGSWNLGDLCYPSQWTAFISAATLSFCTGGSSNQSLLSLRYYAAFFSEMIIRLGPACWFSFLKEMDVTPTVHV